jgi:hypothetical protein
MSLFVMPLATSPATSRSRLVVSKRTVDAHLEHILGKLGYSSRREVAALASQERDRGHPERERQEQPARP